MNYGFVDDLSSAEMLHHYPLQQRRAHGSVPHTLRINDDDRPALTHTKAWRFAALDARRAEKQPFTLE